MIDLYYVRLIYGSDTYILLKYRFANNNTLLISASHFWFPDMTSPKEYRLTIFDRVFYSRFIGYVIFL